MYQNILVCRFCSRLDWFAYYLSNRLDWFEDFIPDWTDCVIFTSGPSFCKHYEKSNFFFFAL